MKILWILHGCGLEGRGITGGPVRYHEISRRFQKQSIEQFLLTTKGGRDMLQGMGSSIPDAISPASLVFKREPCRAFRLWSYIVTTLSFRKALRSAPKSDVAITVSDYFCDIVPALRFKRLHKGKWVAWIHHRETPPKMRPGNPLVNRLTYKMQEWSLRKIAANADEAWVYDTDAGDLVKERLIAFGMAPERIRIMRCGVNVEEISRSREPQKDVDAVMVGLRPNKGLFDIIPIWEKVLAKRPDTTLRLMGGMSGETEVLEEIRNKGLDKNIQVFRPEGGFLPTGEYYSKLKSARIMFAPSHEEGWGMAVCEAMAAGLPVVAYDLPVYRRIYGNAFRQIPSFDFDSFAESIVELLDDKATFDQYQSKGLETAKDFGWDVIAASDVSALKEMFEKHL